MDRGLRAPLSTREETALRRVALGNARRQDLAFAHRRRLKQLDLVKETHGRLALTETGREQVASITPKPLTLIADMV